MRRADAINFMKKRSSRRYIDTESSQKEDSPELPVPRRKTNALSMLRKLVKEYDTDQLESSVPRRRLDPDSAPGDASDDKNIPDHCWVGEYLDDEEIEKRPPYSIPESRLRDSLNRKSIQSFASSSRSSTSMSPFSISKEVVSPRVESASYHEDFDDATNREIKELQREERAREELLYKIMLESMEYRAELQRLKGEASLRKSQDSAKVFDYDHGVRELTPNLPSYQRSRAPSVKLNDAFEDESELPVHSRRYEDRVYTSESELLTPEMGSTSFRKIMNEGDFDHVKLVRKSSNSPLPGSLRNNSYGRVTRTEKSEAISKKRKFLDDNTPTLYKDYEHDGSAENSSTAGAMSSFGSALPQINKVAHVDTSQSYEDYLDELKLRLLEEEEDEDVRNTTQRSNEVQHIQGSKQALGALEGRPISVLTSVHPKQAEPVDPMEEYRCGSNEMAQGMGSKMESFGESPPLKIKPALKKIQKDTFRKELHGSGMLLESFEGMSSSRLVLGNFNDTRKVLLEDSAQYDRQREVSEQSRSSRVVVDCKAQAKTALPEKSSFSLNTRSRGDSRKAKYHRDRRIENKGRASKRVPLNVRGDGDHHHASDENDCVEPFLHRRRPTLFNKELIDELVTGNIVSTDGDVPHYAKVSGVTPVQEEQFTGQYSLHDNLAKLYPHDGRKINADVNRTLMHKDYQIMPTKSSDYSEETGNVLPVDSRHYGKVKEKRSRSDSKSKSLGFGGRPPMVSDTHRQGDNAEVPGVEYIDQFSNRHIKIWTDSSSNAPSQERLVERPAAKSQSLWEEEVDRYVNMSVGEDKAETADARNRHENISLETKALHGKAGSRRRSRRPPRRKSSRSHSHTPILNRKSEEHKLTSLHGRGKDQRKSGIDERRFENRSPHREKQDSLSRYSMSGNSDIRKFTARGRQRNEVSHTTGKSTKSPRKALKRAKLSPSPVPLMPADWCSSKIVKSDDAKIHRSGQVRIEGRKVMDSGRRMDASSVAPLVEVENRSRAADTSRKDLKDGNAQPRGSVADEALRTRIASEHMQTNKNYQHSKRITPPKPKEDPAKRNTDSRKTENLGNKHFKAEAPTKTKTQDTQKASLVRKDVKQAPLKGPLVKKDVKQVPSRDKEAMMRKQSDSSNRKKSSSALPIKKKLAYAQKSTDSNVGSDKVLSESNDVPSKIPADREIVVPPVGKADVVKKTSSSSSKENMKLLSTKPSGSKEQVPVTLTPTKPVTQKVLPATKRKIPLKRKSSSNDGKKNAKVSKILKPDSSATSTQEELLVNEEDGNWMQRYQKWFTDVLALTLSSDEQVKSLGWNDPMQFLQCVTNGNKRAMSYIPRGIHAKRMLHFIALNKKATHSDIKKPSKDSALDVTAEFSKNDDDLFFIDRNPSNLDRDQKKDDLKQKDLQSDGSTCSNMCDDNKISDTVHNQNSSCGPTNLRKIVEDEAGSSLEKTLKSDEGIVKSDNMKHHATEVCSSQTVVASITQPELAQSIDATKKDIEPKAQNKDSVTQGDDKDMALKKKSSALPRNPRKDTRLHQPVISVKDDKQTHMRQSNELTRPGKAMLPSDTTKLNLQGSKGPVPAKIVDKKVTHTDKEKKSSKSPPRKNQRSERVRPKEDWDAQKGRKISSTYKGSSSRSKHNIQSHDYRHSVNEIIIPTEEPKLTSAQRRLLPDFKKSVEQTARRSFNILYGIKNFNNRKLDSVARDALKLFEYSNRQTCGFTTEHALYYMLAFFERDSSDSEDDARRQLQRYDLKGPPFDYSVEEFFKFHKLVLSLCDKHFDARKSFTAQAEFKKSYVRQKAEYLFPQFSNEAHSLIKLWMWTVRMGNVVRKGLSYKTDVRLQPFPDDNGEPLEDRIAAWTSSVSRGQLYNLRAQMTYAMVCAVKTELMKRKSQATRQEAMNLLTRSWIMEHFRTLQSLQKPVEENAPMSVVDIENSELMVLDEVYSNESEEDLDIVDDSESVLIDLF